MKTKTFSLWRLLAVTFGLAATLQAATVKEGLLEYKVGDTVCEGWYARPDNDDGKSKPGILIIHQWTGISDHEKSRAHLLAEMGYHVLVADIYGKGIRPQPPASKEESSKYKNDRKLFRERLQGGLDTLTAQPNTDKNHIVAIGYCFGGTGVLELARSGAAVEGVVSFHGGLGTPTPEDAKNIKGQVLVCHGADDPFVPPAEVEAFQKEMKDASVKYELIAYPGAVHSFTQKSAGNDNSKGSAYNADADEKSWAALKKLLADLFN